MEEDNYPNETYINLPIKVLFTDIEENRVSAYIPKFNIYFSSTKENLQRKTRGLVAIWAKFNLETNMAGKNNSNG